MIQQNFKKMLRISDLCEIMNLSRSSIYRKIQQCLIPPPVKYSHGSRWPDFEIIEILNALISGQNQEQIKQLVFQIVENRRSTGLTVYCTQN